MNLNVLISKDFFTFSAKGYGNDWKTVVRNFLRLDPDLFTEMPYGGNGGYAKSAVYNDIIVYYNGREALNEHDQITYPMGVCVSMSGNGCKTFNANCEKYQLFDLFEFLIPYCDSGEVNITRLDIAADDKCKLLNIRKIERYLKTGKVNCRFDKARKVEDMAIRRPEDNAETIYIGSDKSDLRFRIYNKAAEQRDKGIECDGHWVRFEMVCRDEYAQSAVRALVKNKHRLGECVSEMFKAHIDFIELDHTRRTNCTVAKWWEKFIGVVQAVEFYYKDKPARTADKLYSWIKDSLSASLATAYQMFGDDFIRMILRNGNKRLSKFQQALVNDYYRSQGLTPPYLEDWQKKMDEMKLELDERELKRNSQYVSELDIEYEKRKSMCKAQYVPAFA